MVDEGQTLRFHVRKMTDRLFAIQLNFFTTGLSNKHLEPEDTETHQHRVHITSAVCCTAKPTTPRVKAQMASISHFSLLITLTSALSKITLLRVSSDFHFSLEACS